MTNNKLIPVCILVVLQFGCAEQVIRQEPAPVHRSQTKINRNNASKSVQTFKYPDQAEAGNLAQMQEIVPENNQAISSAPPGPNIPSEPFSPPVLALVSEAEQNTQAGQYESAAVKIERALRIDPRNAQLTYKLASIRLKQEQPRLAEDLAKKAALLAGSDRSLKKQIWILIAESRRLQQDAAGATQAEQKAAEY